MILLENGRFYAPSCPGTSAILIDQGRIVAVSDQDHPFEINQKIDARYDLQGRTVWPGLTDSHIHLASYSLDRGRVSCETGTIEECLMRVDQAASKTVGGGWIVGHGWNQNDWSGGYGTATQLDSVSHGHPIFLTSKSLHAAWANSQALQSAGITGLTPDPEGGKILRSGAGEPSGILLESAAQLVRNIIPRPTREEFNQSLKSGIQALLRMGITTVHDFDGLAYLDDYRQLEESGELNLRILKIIPPDDHLQALEQGLQSRQRSQNIQIGPFKYFMDGALGPHTAALEEPYDDDPNNLGVLNHTALEILEGTTDLLVKGCDLTIHAIGDRANREAIAVYREIRRKERESNSRHARLRIEHVQLLAEGQAAEFHQLGITPSMQPIHATSDMRMADKYWGKRVNQAYAWHTLLTHGAPLIFGSDAPVENPNPFWGLHAAVTRRRRDGSPCQEGWIPTERIELQEALEAYSRTPALWMDDPGVTGSLEPNANADLIVLPCDPFKEKAQNLHQISPVATMVSGKWVWMDQDSGQ